jgi:VMA21-like domain
MATRRIITTEKGALDIDSSGFTKPAEEKSNITPAVPAYVIPSSPPPLAAAWEKKSHGWCLVCKVTNDIFLQCRHVIFKLLGFTLAMVVCPLGTYFLSLNIVFGGMFVPTLSLPFMP